MTASVRFRLSARIFPSSDRLAVLLTHLPLHHAAARRVKVPLLKSEVIIDINYRHCVMQFAFVWVTRRAGDA